MKRLLSFLSAEKEKIAALSGPGAKAEYIWQYYKLWIIGIVCGVSLLGYIFYQVNTALSENWFYITFTNTYAEVGDGSDLWEGFVEYADFDLTEKNVIFNNTSYFDYAQNQGVGNDYYNVFVSYTDSGTLDCVDHGGGLPGGAGGQRTAAGPEPGGVRLHCGEVRGPAGLL